MSQISNEKDYITRWNKKPGFYEVYYLKMNDLSGKKGFWFRYTLLAPDKGTGEAVCELWSIAFDKNHSERNVAHKLTLPISELSFSTKRFSFAVGAHELNYETCKGSLGEGNEKISWDLNFHHESFPTFFHFSNKALYVLPLPKTKVCSPDLSMHVSGTVTAWGKEYAVEKFPAHMAHIWGTKHASEWLWANCNTFQDAEGTPAVFEALSARIKLGGLNVPKLTLAHLRIGKDSYTFNQPLQLVQNFSYHDIRMWQIEAEGEKHRLRAQITADPKDMVGVTYTDPDGETRICHNTKVADMTATLERFEGGIWKTDRTLKSLPHTVAFEVVMPNADPSVRVLL